MRPSHILKAAAVVLNTLVITPTVIVLSIFDRDAKIAYRLAIVWAWLNLRASRVRMSVRGLENLDPNASYVFMSNHRSNADIVALAWALRRYQLRWVAKKELLAVPVFGWGLRALGNIIVDRSNREGAIESYRRAREKMARGISVMVFPEGTRGGGGELLPFKKGGFVFALETRRPVVPVAVVGTDQVLARNGWKLERGAVEVRVGRPIETVTRSLDDRDSLVEDVREEIASLLQDGDAAVGRARVVGQS